MRAAPGRGGVALVALALGVLFPGTALAYVGPGLGAGVVAVVVGILVALILLFIGIVWYPLRRLFRWFRGKKHGK